MNETQFRGSRRKPSILNPFWVFGVVLAVFGFFVMPLSKALWHAGREAMVLQEKLSIVLGGVSAIVYSFVRLRGLVRGGFGDRMLFVGIVVMFGVLVVASAFLR
jgi:hypothetical protein